MGMWSGCQNIGYLEKQAGGRGKGSPRSRRNENVMAALVDRKPGVQQRTEIDGDHSV
jgi:hypothetical protein